MPIDASIALQGRPVQIDNPMNAMARALQLKGLIQQQEAGEFDAQLKRRQIDEQNRLQSILAGGGGADELMRGGFVEPALKIRKEAREDEESRVKTSKDRAEVKGKQYQFMANVLADVKDQAGYDRALMLADSYGMDLSKIPRQFDPAFVQQAAGAFTTQAQRWADQRQREQQAETGRHNRETEKTAAGQLGVAQGNLGLRKQELDLQKNQPKGQFLETPTGYVLADPRSNAVQPVIGPDGKQLRGKSADKSLTDAQAKANLFGSRMAESHRILSDLTGQFSPAAVQAKMAAGETPFLGGAFGAMGNIMLSKEGQMAEQAMRDFINAVLRRESGAVISPPEFANAAKQYFPQPNDTPEVLAQKKRNREIAIAGLAAEVPGGLRSLPTLQSPGAATPDNDPLGIRK